MEHTTIVLPDLCRRHKELLLWQLGIPEDGPWRAAIFATQIALFQAATCDPKIHEKCHGKLYTLLTFGCIACQKPDTFGEIVHAGQTKGLNGIKALGEFWVSDRSMTANDSDME